MTRESWRQSLRKIFMFSGGFLNDLKREEIKVTNRTSGAASLSWSVWKLAEVFNIALQRDWARGTICRLVLFCALECCCVKVRTSPSLVSTVRTRMLLFTWASGVLVSRLVSKYDQREKKGTLRAVLFFIFSLLDNQQQRGDRGGERFLDIQTEW